MHVRCGGGGLALERGDETCQAQTPPEFDKRHNHREIGDNTGLAASAGDVAGAKWVEGQRRRTRNMRDVSDWRNNFSISEVDELFRTGAMFTARGFSHSTIKALVLGGIDAPERLLFADEAELASIPGLDEVALEEIMRYRGQFVGSPRKQIWRGVPLTTFGAPSASSVSWPQPSRSTRPSPQRLRVSRA
jgi:hypothetical protein